MPLEQKTVKKYKKTDKKGNQYLLLSSLKDRNIYKDRVDLGAEIEIDIYI